MKIKVYTFITLSCFLFLSSCKTGDVAGSKAVVLPTAVSGENTKESSVLWQQTSAEYTALCYQAFNSAKFFLSTIMLDQMTVADRKFAVILDLDETVLDNSPYNGYLVKTGDSYSQDTWYEWTNYAQAELVPGARDFIQYLQDKQISIFYVSNRRVDELGRTIDNLNKKEVMINPENIMLREKSSEKESRRKKIMNDYKVIMLVGDNLADFSDVFEQDVTITERKEMVENVKDNFGSKFIVLPNVMYGGWEKAMRMNDPSAIQDENINGNGKYIKSFK